MNKHFLIETPGTEVVVDFLSFHPEKGVRVAAVSVRLEIRYDKMNKEAYLYVSAVDDFDSTILLDEKEEIAVEEEDEDDDGEEE